VFVQIRAGSAENAAGVGRSNPVDKPAAFELTRLGRQQGMVRTHPPPLGARDGR
jgi:hypothetical protein